MGNVWGVFRDNDESVNKIVQQVMQGEWGNGQERIQRLTEAGYDAGIIQEKVNLCITRITS